MSQCTRSRPGGAPTLECNPMMDAVADWLTSTPFRVSTANVSRWRAHARRLCSLWPLRLACTSPARTRQANTKRSPAAGSALIDTYPRVGRPPAKTDTQRHFRVNPIRQILWHLPGGGWTSENAPKRHCDASFARKPQFTCPQLLIG